MVTYKWWDVLVSWWSFVFFLLCALSLLRAVRVVPVDGALLGLQPPVACAEEGDEEAYG